MKLPKSARLHHKSLQDKLFSEGKKLSEYPLRMLWRALSREQLQSNFRDRVPDLIGPVQVLVSVPKKKRRKAVDRVLMRRRIREAYRLGRGPLVGVIASIPAIRTVSIALVYMKEGNTEFEEIKEKFDRLIEKLVVKLKDQEHEKISDESSDNTD